MMGKKGKEKITNKNDYESIPPGIKKRIKCHYLLFLQKRREKKNQKQTEGIVQFLSS